MNSYRGIEIEVFGNGYIVSAWGDEVYCDTIAAAENVIDEYLDE